MHLLLIEDDLDLGRSLQQALAAAGLTSHWLRTAGDGRRFFRTERYDGVLLDLGLPDGDGLALLHEWRQAGVTVPVILITARDGLDDRLRGLDGGADDFVIKPFAVPELIARIHAVTRRSAQQASLCWQIGSLTIDVARCEVRLAGEPLALSRREFDLLVALARAAGAVLPKHRLAQALAPLGDAVDFNAIEVHVHHLRRKLGADWIRTVRGVGYQLAAPTP